MIKVILPNRGPLASLDAAVISDIVQRLFNTESYDTETEDRRDGRYIKVINCDENIIHYVCLSNPDNSGRNSRLMQFITPAYIAYYNEQIENKKIDAYVISPSGNDKNDYSVKTNGVIYPEELQSMGENLPTGFNIKTEHYNAHMHEYLDIHKERVTTM